jgi:signal transduction histidine kinase
MNKELLSTEGTHGEQGSGLGLSIAKSFVDSYGGKMSFENKDRGTFVRLSLNKA